MYVALMFDGWSRSQGSNHLLGYMVAGFGCIWTNKRNRLLMGRAAMLAFVYFNKRVMDRIEATPTDKDWLEMLDAMDERDPLVSAADDRDDEIEEVGTMV